MNDTTKTIDPVVIPTVMPAPETNSQIVVSTLGPQATTQVATFDFAPRNLEEAIKLADYMANSTIVPKDYIGKPGNILVAMQWGMEVGLKPLQAMQNIAVINGRPSLWGDGMLAIVRNSPLCEYIREVFDGETATCFVKRRGEPEDSRSFSLEDAKKARLLGKDGPWTQYPQRMLKMRARAWALRDIFPDVLKGMAIAEELLDAERATPTMAAPAAPRRRVEKDITPPAGEAPNPDAEPAQDGPAGAGQIAFIRKKLAAAKIEEGTLCAEIGVDALDHITLSQGNAALLWIRQQ